MKSKARVIAFYLPQYYPIPENDEWWGKGFTEWTNVGKAKPLFRGHYQPHVPADLGYYDLRLPIIREQQAEMAKEAGIEGFCYWHYWFGNGRTLLTEVFDDVLHSGKPDFPFCLGWANHDWSRRTWNNSEAMHKNVDLMIQEYPGEHDYINHFYSVLPAFKDPRYITVDGKPLFYIYAAAAVPDLQTFMDIWRKLALENGLKGIHFVGQSTGWAKNADIVLKKGVDAVVSEVFWKTEAKIDGKMIRLLKAKLMQYFPMLSPVRKYKYKDIIRNLYSDYEKKENVYPIILPNWDRSPRAGKRAVVYTDCEPKYFRKNVQEALNIVKEKAPEHRIIFLKSWNEWGEGNHVEPDLKYGHGYLDALKEVIF